MTKPVIIGNATLYLGDCLEILPTLPKVDAVITDPPYGIAMDKIRSKESTSSHGGRKAYEFVGWDAQPPPKVAFDLIFEKSERQVIWGANYFPGYLPGSMGWLVWDKGQRIDSSDAELAFTNMQKALRVFTLNRVALMTDGALHPTQKPVALIQWCLQQAGNPTEVVDPYMGSGTTGVACMKSGATFIGIEIEPKYFEIACERIENAQRQERLFA